MKAKEVILCIDDEPIILRLIKGQLEPKFGDHFDLRFAENAESAKIMLNEIQANKQPLVMAIVDQLLPGQLGHEFLAEISEMYPNLVKILFSGKSDFDTVIRGINEAQIFRYLIKPWDETDFINIIQRGLQQYYIQESIDAQLAELHHRVKNNLTIITCLLELQISELPDVSTKLHFQDSINRINSIARVHELIYDSDDMSSVDFERYLERIIPTIKASKGHVETNVSVELNITDYPMRVNQAIPLGLLFNELISNSYKYAFPGKTHGTISISMKDKWNRLHFVYEDDGVGFSNGIQFDDSKNLGLTLINLQLQQLDCEFTVDTNGKFQLEFSFDTLKINAMDYTLGLLPPPLVPI